MAANNRLLAFSTELQEWVRTGDYTQAGLARALEEQHSIKVTASAVGEWMRGESEPSRDKVFALEDVLDLEPGTLTRTLGYEPPKTVHGVAHADLGALTLSVAASGVNLEELRRLDPEAYEAIIRQAEIALDRARGRRRRRR